MGLLSVEQALAEIEARVEPQRSVPVALSAALGMTLAEEIAAPLDSPPFTKSLMDGYAVCAADVADGTARLRVIDEVTAGNVSQKSLTPGNAIRIMTGAPVPDGADAVVRIEDTTFDSDAQTVSIETQPVLSGASILPRGAAMQAGQRVLPVGRILRPQEIGALAEMGFAKVNVFPPPRVAVLATGDELVEVGEIPAAGQIRNSNESMLVAQIARAGATAVPLGIARDNADEIRGKVERGLDADILCLSGGVSAGKLDLVPGVLAAAGVEQVFHKVAVKPGKPVWFGVKTSDAGTKLVFGLPGNPVSSMVCFELFVRPAIRRLSGRLAAANTGKAVLAADHIARGDRPTYHPCRLNSAVSPATFEPVAWQGSADLSATVRANAMAFFPQGGNYQAGDVLDVIPWQADCPTEL